MSYYRVCEYCGAFLDPGEKCDCRSAAEELAHDMRPSASPRHEKKTAQEGSDAGEDEPAADRKNLLRKEPETMELKQLNDQEMIAQVKKGAEMIGEVLEELADRRMEARATYQAAAISYAKSVEREGQEKAAELADVIKRHAVICERIEAEQRLRPVAIMTGDPEILKEYEERLRRLEEIEATLRADMEEKKAGKATGSESLWIRTSEALEAYKRQQENSRQSAKAVAQIVRALIDGLQEEAEEATLRRFEVEEPIREELEPEAVSEYHKTGVDFSDLADRIAAGARG